MELSFKSGLYTTPQIEILAIDAEQCFASSTGYGENGLPGTNPGEDFFGDF